MRPCALSVGPYATSRGPMTRQGGGDATKNASLPPCLPASCAAHILTVGALVRWPLSNVALPHCRRGLFTGLSHSPRVYVLRGPRPTRAKKHISTHSHTPCDPLRPLATPCDPMQSHLGHMPSQTMQHSCSTHAGHMQGHASPMQLHAPPCNAMHAQRASMPPQPMFMTCMSTPETQVEQARMPRATDGCLRRARPQPA